MSSRSFSFFAALTLIAAGCSQKEAEYPENCRKGPGDDVKMAGRTAGQGVEAGAETGVAGVKQAGRAVGGWFEGGSAIKRSGRRARSNEQEAREGRAEVGSEQLPAARSALHRLRHESRTAAR
jgi:hypothetical protein